MITRRISVFDAFPSTCERQLLGRTWLQNNYIIYIYIQCYRLIVRYLICSSLHLNKEPCCCITMCCKPYPSIVIWFVRTTFSSLPSYVFISEYLLPGSSKKVGPFAYGICPCSTNMVSATAEFYLYILPPFFLKSRPNIECLVSKRTYNPVRFCRC